MNQPKERHTVNAQDDRKATEAVLAMYDEADREMVRVAAESKTPGVPRAEEIAPFARRAGFRKIGIAHCVAVTAAAEKLEEMLAKEFEVTRVGCKVFGLDASELLAGGKGTSCNPVGQAKVLNDAGTELNVAMGLCLGHDLLFAKHSAAPVTTLVVKDRVHNHNPLAALT